MTKHTTFKYAIFVAIILLGVLADQWTKHYAERRLANPRLGHEVTLVVPQTAAPAPLGAYLASEFTWSTPEHIEQIVAGRVSRDDGTRLTGEAKVSAGDVLHVTYRKATVVEGYFDFEYARNPGAAFSFLATADESYRKPFFLLVSILAFGVVLYILRGVRPDQRVMLYGLSLVASGALGNFIDRVRFGYVIDFILWKYTNEHRWPTFNVADALICIGIGLIFIEIIRESRREKQLKREEEAAAAAQA